jgi:starch-binding outer membrane protein, SusD/RagB family
MKHISFTTLLFLISLSVIQSGCKKYLDAKSNKDLVIPTTLQDVQALSDNYDVWNLPFSVLGDMSDDNYTWPLATFNMMPFDNPTADYKNIHVWKKESNTDLFWSRLYQTVYHVNVALETLENITPDASNMADWRRLRGTCLFVRAYTYSFIVNFFAEPYTKATASQTPGIPLRLNPDPNPVSVRASLEESYQQIVRDLKEASQLLPYVNTPISRPSRAAAFAALSRVYLYMHEYELAKVSSDSCLSIYNTLIDYKSVANTSNPFPRWNQPGGNPEVIFPSYYLSISAMGNNWRVDSALYKSYSPNDQRKKLFFTLSLLNGDSTYTFKGDYEGTPSSSSFNGLAVDEVYLTRAECRARLNDKDGALQDLNTLMQKRWDNTWVPFTAPTAEDALVLILNERRKELIVRGGLRWFDLRRLNKDPRFAKELKRTYNGITYTLPPNDPRYTFYIPQIVIDLTGMQQNVR